MTPRDTGWAGTLRAGWLVAGLLLATGAGRPVRSAEARRAPNFIVILGEGAGWTSTSVQMDDRNPASRGTAIRTPHLERLAAAGMRFSDGYAASPRCTPSRASLFTGRSPAALHMTFVGEGRRDDTAVNTRLLPPRASLELPAEEVTIGTLLKRSGYATAHFGKWHVGRVNPSQHGFDESDGPTGNGGPENVPDPNPKQAIAMTARGIDFMERQVKAKKPFYLQLSHYPSQGEKRGGGEGRAPGRQEDLQREEVSSTDRSVGAILDAVSRLGIRADTYVMYTTDHGTPGRNLPLTGGKGTVWEGGIRVPFLVVGPGVAPGTCSHVRVSATDLLPTFAELAGGKTPLPRGVEGGSFASVLRGGTGPVTRPRDEFVVHFPHYDKDALGPASALLLSDYKLIRDYETGSRRLFRLREDPAERHDLSAQLPQKVAELDRRLNSYLAAVHAQMPVPNPSFDPNRPAEPPSRRGGGRRKGPDGRNDPP